MPTPGQHCRKASFFPASLGVAAAAHFLASTSRSCTVSITGAAARDGEATGATIGA